MNGISDPGACILAGAMQRNKCVRRLKLFHNKIGDSGAKALALALSTHKSELVSRTQPAPRGIL